MSRGSLMLVSLSLVAACGGQANTADPAPGPTVLLPPDDPVPVTTTPDDRGLIIVTTDAIASRSQKLAPFVADKQRLGFHVHVATEQQYGGASLRGAPRAKMIRNYLATIAGDYRYLLLIGDADPRFGDVPMFVAWPRHEQPANECLRAFPIDCRSCETDIMYGVLDREWDLDGNKRAGEHGRDDGDGGIGFDAGLIVGRIPVFFNDVDELDRILAHAIAYTTQTPAEARYRRRVVLPASIFYFRGQRLSSSRTASDIDGAAFADWLVRNELSGREDLTYLRLYEQEGTQASRYPSDGALTQQAVLDELQAGAGVVIWAGHGMPRHVVRTVWREDADGDGFAGADELTSPPLLRAQDVVGLEGRRPGFAVASSCEVGSAEVPYNLSYSLLLAGAVVGIAASSSVTPGSGTGSPFSDDSLRDSGFGSDNAAVYVLRGLLDGHSAAAALADAKRELGTARTAECYAGKMMINHFGDPTLTLDQVNSSEP